MATEIKAVLAEDRPGAIYVTEVDQYDQQYQCLVEWAPDDKWGWITSISPIRYRPHSRKGEFNSALEAIEDAAGSIFQAIREYEKVIAEALAAVEEFNREP